jgi:hypothetical protein
MTTSTFGRILGRLGLTDKIGFGVGKGLTLYPLPLRIGIGNGIFLLCG